MRISACRWLMPYVISDAFAGMLETKQTYMQLKSSEAKRRQACTHHWEISDFSPRLWILWRTERSHATTNVEGLESTRMVVCREVSRLVKYWMASVRNSLDSQPHQLGTAGEETKRQAVYVSPILSTLLRLGLWVQVVGRRRSHLKSRISFRHAKVAGSTSGMRDA